MPGGQSKREPPDPIPTSEVKPLSADDSADYLCESRELPGSNYSKAPCAQHPGLFVICSNIPRLDSAPARPSLFGGRGAQSFSKRPSVSRHWRSIREARLASCVTTRKLTPYASFKSNISPSTLSAVLRAAESNKLPLSVLKHSCFNWF